MDYGINLAPAADSWKLVARAEELGFSHAWFIDSQLVNADVFVAMAAAAVNTSRIRLGTGMLIPSNRIAPVAANALASLNKLAPGRIDFGAATGNTARRTMGLKPVTLAELADYIRVVRGLLARHTVAFHADGEMRKIRFLNPELDLINTHDPIPLFISALGPRGRRLVAELGANWTIPVGGAAAAVAALDHMKRAWRDAGRDPGDLYATASAGGCVLAVGEAHDSKRAKAQAGPSAAMFLHDLVENSVHGELGSCVPPDLVDAYRKIWRGYQPADARYLDSNRGHLMIVRPEEEHLVTAGLIQAMTMTGTAADLRDRIRALADAGFRQFTTHVRFGQEQMLEEWSEVFAGV